MRSRCCTFFIVLVALSATAVVRADPTDEFIRAQMKAQNIPGLSLAVLQDGKIVKAAGYGLADRERKTPVTPETVFRIASVSKQFIAAGLMLLVQEGRLGADDSINKYLADAPAAWKGITLRHLLSHTSGLVREAPGFSPTKIQIDADVIRSAYSQPLRFAPGEKYEYGNLSYFIAAELIHRVSGRPWTEFLHEKLFKPLAMHRTYPTNTTQPVPDRARGYSDNEKLQPVDEWPALRASGAFLSTVLDLAKWDAALYTDQILNAATREQMWTPARLNGGGSHGYGLGWQLESHHGRRLVHHGGGMPGFGAEFARYVDDRLTIIMLINLDDADEDSIARGVARLYLPAQR
jgi:CubicO group peptidase (beta-lactamase class C family)